MVYDCGWQMDWLIFVNADCNSACAKLIHWLCKSQLLQTHTDDRPEVMNIHCMIWAQIYRVLC